jgi:hypothetical protein
MLPGPDADFHPARRSKKVNHNGTKDTKKEESTNRPYRRRPPPLFLLGVLGVLVVITLFPSFRQRAST